MEDLGLDELSMRRAWRSALKVLEQREPNTERFLRRAAEVLSKYTALERP